jgi:hypothetical protein
VQCGGVHPDWFDGQQGCSQLSTDSFLDYEIIVNRYIPVVGEQLLRIRHREVWVDADRFVEVHNGLVNTVDQQVDLAPKSDQIC